jgi:hypothetical protein
MSYEAAGDDTLGSYEEGDTLGRFAPGDVLGVRRRVRPRMPRARQPRRVALSGTLEQFVEKKRKIAGFRPIPGYYGLGDIDHGLQGDPGHPDVNLGFSLKRPRWARKLTLKKVLPYAAIAGAFFIPGVAPAAAAAVRGAGGLALRGGRGLFSFGRRALRGATRAAGPATTSTPPILPTSGMPDTSADASYDLTKVQAQMADQIVTEAAYGGGEGDQSVAQGAETIEEAPGPGEEPPIETSTPGPGKAIAQKLPQLGPIALYGLGALILYSLARGVGRRR